MDDKSTTLVLSPAAFSASNSLVVYTTGCVRGVSNATVRAGIPLPVGVVITGITAWVIDSGAGDDAISLTKTSAGFVTVATINTTGAVGIQRLSSVLVIPELVEPGEYFAFEFIGFDTTASHSICGVEIDYTSP